MEHNQIPVTIRLRALIPDLGPAEQKVARVVLKSMGSVRPTTVAEVAATAEVSTATVVRLYQRLGYRKFHAFWLDAVLQAKQEELTNQQLEPAMGDIDRADSFADIVNKLYYDEALSLADTARCLDLRHMQAGVDAIVGATRLDLFGMGAGAVVVHDFQQKLSRVGRTALAWGDAHSAWTAAATLGPGCVALAVSHSGRTSEAVDFLTIAQTTGATTIAVTNFAGSPLAKNADIVLLTAAREAPFRSGALGSRTAQHFVLDALFIAIAQASYDNSMQALRKTYAVIHRSA